MTDPDVRVPGKHNHIPQETIAMMFARFEQAVLGHWSHQWRLEARNIWYSGFQAAMRTLASGGSEMTEEVWQAYFQQLHAEMGRHIETVIAAAAAVEASPAEPGAGGPSEDPT